MGNIFSMKNIGSYHYLYVQIDTLLLTDIFENFRDTFLKTYKLDPANFHSPARPLWTVALKFTTGQLELLTDNEMLQKNMLHT